jgi:hypothetical protein
VIEAFKSSKITYTGIADLSAMVINGSWNKRSGPGGSTRRLHQIV